MSRDVGIDNWFGSDDPAVIAAREHESNNRKGFSSLLHNHGEYKKMCRSASAGVGLRPKLTRQYLAFGGHEARRSKKIKVTLPPLPESK